jgi:glycosyltransferase involved in cell wall biosynthesis
VIVPNLNGRRYLAETLESIAAQTHPGIETIIVDGGSTDGSLELISNWAQRHDARWISEPDTGQANAINKGLNMATGEILTWLNSDDVWHPHAARIAAGEFGADPQLDFLWGFCTVIDELGRPRHVMNSFVRSTLADLRVNRNFVPQPASFFHRRLINRYGLLEESYDYMFDYEFFLRFAGEASARFVPEVLAGFRIHADSKTGSVHKRFLVEERRAFRAHGGRTLSPFFLDYWRYRLVAAPLERAKVPARRLLWRLFGLPEGARIRG